MRNRTSHRAGNPYPVFTVIGCGNGGQAIAGHLSLLGFRVVLYNRSPEPLAAIQRAGGIRLEGAVTGTGVPAVVTDDLSEALAAGDVIMVTVPATAHAGVARSAAPYLRTGQIIVLNPGRTGGALEFRATLDQAGCTTRVVVSETDTLIYACRSLAGACSRINSIKDRVAVAALPATDTDRVVRVLRLANPRFTAASSVLETGFGNIGALFHPAPVLMNAARIELAELPFEFYREGITPAVARVIRTMDRERMAVAVAFGVQVGSVLSWLDESYGVRGRTLYGAIQANPAYQGIVAPAGLNSRYVLEDLPTGLVPLSSLGQLAGVPTPAIDSVITLASVTMDRDFRSEGRTVARLGLSGLTPAEVLSRVLHGELVCRDQAVGLDD